MTDNTVIKTYWQPLGQTYWAEHVTTLGEAIKYNSDFAKPIKNGASIVTISYTEVSNPGTLIAIANIK